VLSTILREGNFDYVTNSVRWDTSAQTIPNSLYLTAKPAFFGSNPWPWVDPTGATKLHTLPAKARYDSGNPNGPTPTPSPTPVPSPTPTPNPSLSINDASVDEGPSGTRTISFTVTLSAAAAGSVTVSYTTANGTATAGSDYTTASGTLTFTAGQTSRPVAVTVAGDATIENDETFTVNLGSATGATISRAQGTGTIRNDDFPAASVADASTTEGNSGTKALVFTVTLSAATPQTVTIPYTTTNGTATAGSDYAASAGSVTFTANQTSRTISVTINGDTAVEANETFTLTLSSPTNATLADGSATGTITNDDSPTPSPTPTPQPTPTPTPVPSPTPRPTPSRVRRRRPFRCPRRRRERSRWCGPRWSACPPTGTP
jgi:hypothetical protein